MENIKTHLKGAASLGRSRAASLGRSRAARRVTSPEPQAVIEAVAAHFGVEPSTYRRRRSGAAGRDFAAYLSHRWTGATFRELAAPFGLGHPDSVSKIHWSRGEGVGQVEGLAKGSR